MRRGTGARRIDGDAGCIRVRAQPFRWALEMVSAPWAVPGVRDRRGSGDRGLAGFPPRGGCLRGGARGCGSAPRRPGHLVWASGRPRRRIGARSEDRNQRGVRSRRQSPRPVCEAGHLYGACVRGDDGAWASVGRGLRGRGTLGVCSCGRCGCATPVFSPTVGGTHRAFPGCAPVGTRTTLAPGWGTRARRRPDAGAPRCPVSGSVAGPVLDGPSGRLAPGFGAPGSCCQSTSAPARRVRDGSRSIGSKPDADAAARRVLAAVAARARPRRRQRDTRASGPADVPIASPARYRAFGYRASAATGRAEQSFGIALP